LEWKNNFFFLSEFLAKIEKYMKQDDWYLWVSSKKGSVTYPVFTSLDAYWPGILVCDLRHKRAWPYHQIVAAYQKKMEPVGSIELPSLAKLES
jgi:hypothetical protein